MDEESIKEIDSIVFGVYSPEEIIKMSVCKIDNPKKSGYGTVYDERMGTCDSTKKCESCDESASVCPGHFGHIELNEPIMHPLFYKRILAFLNCFCLKCCRLLLLKDQINIAGLNRYRGEARFTKIQEKLKRVDMCCHDNCGSDQPRCKFSPTDCSIYKVYENKEMGKTSILLTVEEIKKIFDNILPEDIELLGFDPELASPRNFILTAIPVLPICDRPYVKADGNLCDDDLTNQYIEIVKANNHLVHTEEESGKIKKEITETKRQKCLASLRFRIATTFNNSQGKAKHTTNGRAIKGIKERLAGKDGQIRNNMMGKRAVKFGTMILEWNGNMKKAEDIVVGDIIIGDDGFPRNVIDTLTGESLLYKVKQSNGEDYTISCEHILTLKYCSHANIKWRENQSKYGGWFMHWYDRTSKSIKSAKISVEPAKSIDDAEMELQEFMMKNNLEDKKYNWCPDRKNAGTWRLCYTVNGLKKSKEIPVIPGKTKKQSLDEMKQLRKSINLDPIIDIHVLDYLALSPTNKSMMLGVKLKVPIQWPKKEVQIDPRILGMWLGDGSKNRSIFTNPDLQLIEYFKNWTEKQGGKFNTYEDNLHHGITCCNFIKLLKDNNLYDNKHIPEEYIVNDVQTRLELLAGIIDTDGSVEQEGRTIRIDQGMKHKSIIDGVERIAKSLGYRTSVHTRKTRWSDKDEVKTGEAWELTISGENIHNIPTLLPYKKCVSPSGKDISSTKIDVIEDGVGRYCGFEVDQNNRFLLGDCTITHNCNQTGRTVIGPDSTLKLGELAIPKEMAQILTIPERVVFFNQKRLQELVNNGFVDSLIKPDGKTRINLKRFRRGTRLLEGDIIIRGDQNITVVTGRELVLFGDKIKRNGTLLEKLIPSNREYKVDLEWIVERKLQDGDYVLLNRQPTLHKASMLAMKILIKGYKTLRMNLAITKPFNADFDGDEMNIHAPQSD